MSNVLHALAHLRHHPGSPFLTTLLDHALRQLAAFTPQVRPASMELFDVFDEVVCRNVCPTSHIGTL